MHRREALQRQARKQPSCQGTPCAAALPRLPLHPLLFPSASRDGVAGLEETWQGRAVWFQCQFQLHPGFYNQILKKIQKG